MNDHTFTVRMPVELHERLQAQADAEDLSIAQVVRKAVRQYLAPTTHVVNVPPSDVTSPPTFNPYWPPNVWCGQ